VCRQGSGIRGHHTVVEWHALRHYHEERRHHEPGNVPLETGNFLASQSVKSGDLNLDDAGQETRMNRREAIAAIGTGGLVMAASATAVEPGPVLTVSVVIPELYDLDGSLALAPTLRNAGYGFRFFVVVENVSAVDTYVWAEGNSDGNDTLSFEVIGPDGAKRVIRRTTIDFSKNVPRAARLAPNGFQVWAVNYDPPPDRMAEWDAFPFGAKNTRHEVTLRAVFEQPKKEWGEKLAIWAGRVVSPTYKVVLENQ